MKIKATVIDHQQGSEAWLAHRAKSLNASELAAAMGLSKYMTRAQLIAQKATGIVPDVDAGTQRRYDKGHEFETIARPWAEEIVGDMLYPTVLAAEVDGLPLSASLDGQDLMPDNTFEHKTGRVDLLASLEAGVIPEEYHPQMEQGLMLSGASRCLFMASNGTRESMRYAWYESNPELRAKIIPTWRQFMDDVAAYTPPEIAAEVVAAPVESLPIVSVRMEGSIAVISNLSLFGDKLRAYVDKIDRNPSTDQAFADAEAAIRTLQTAQDALEQAEASALAQTSSIEEMRRTVADYANLARSTRLALEKIVKARKEQIKVEIVTEGRDALAAHIAGLNQRFGRPYMPTVAADFGGAIKGKRTVASLRDAVDTELARAKIEASAIADRIQINLATLTELASDHKFLFADTSTIVLKAADDLTMLVKSRISEHQAAEAKRLEAEREKIRAEEAAKLQRQQEAEARQRAEEEAMRVRNEQARAKRDAELTAAPMEAVTAPAAEPAPVVAAPVVAVRPIHPAAAALRNEQPTLTLGALKDRLGFTVTDDFLAELGFEATAVKASRLYRESQFGDICAALVQHIESVRAEVALAA